MISFADRGRLSWRRLAVAACATLIAVTGVAHASIYVTTQLVELTAAEQSFRNANGHPGALPGVGR